MVQNHPYQRARTRWLKVAAATAPTATVIHIPRVALEIPAESAPPYPFSLLPAHGPAR